jgi:hypothetical protein
MRKTPNRSHLLPVTGDPYREDKSGGTKKRAATKDPIGTIAVRLTRRGATVRTEPVEDAQVTTSGDPLPADGLTVHSKEDNKNRNPTATTNPCFTCLCVKTTGRCKILFSKETNLSSNPTTKASRLDNTLPLRLRVGRITSRTSRQVKTKMSNKSKRTFCAIFCTSFNFLPPEISPKYQAILRKPCTSAESLQTAKHCCDESACLCPCKKGYN